MCEVDHLLPACRPQDDGNSAFTYAFIAQRTAGIAGMTKLTLALKTRVRAETGHGIWSVVTVGHLE